MNEKEIKKLQYQLKQTIEKQADLECMVRDIKARRNILENNIEELKAEQANRKDK